MTLGLALAAAERKRRLDVRLAVDFSTDATAAFRRNFAQFVDSAAPGIMESPVERLFDGVLGQEPTRAERTLATKTGLVHMLVGGPPCQGHSDLNNRTRRKDPRNRFYIRMARAAEVLRPDAILIENVAAVTRDKYGVVDTTRTHLEKLDYAVHAGVVDLSTLGVPQVRKRHVLFAVSDRFGPEKAAAVVETLAAGRSACGCRDTAWAIADLLPQEGLTDFDGPARASRENRRRIDWLFDRGEYDLPDSERPRCHREKAHTYRSVYGRLRWHLPAQTITTGFTSMGQGRFVHPGRRRTITAHEAARLQGFPDFFDFHAAEPAKRTAWSMLIGNAVPPQLTQFGANVILDAIEASDRQRVLRAASC
ncbi:MAG: DNA cytosine methyltransferase [Planctomycetes bacterium]|nr:DNA cytosine methyltransferase [Planctomycetota bacterium]